MADEDEIDLGGSAKYAERPDSLKKLRACKSCKLIKTADQFYRNFCDNCEHTSSGEQDAGARRDFVDNGTTADFEGYDKWRLLPMDARADCG